jgi:hypothetical protein
MQLISKALREKAWHCDCCDSLVSEIGSKINCFGTLRSRTAKNQRHAHRYNEPYDKCEATIKAIETECDDYVVIVL